VIVITGREEQSHAIEAIAQGAYDYYQKPIDAQTLQFVVARALKLADLEMQYQALRETAPSNTPLPGLIATHPDMLTVCRQVERVAATDATVLITGDTGTGKEIIANALHRLSPRKDGPLVTINCAAIPENLLESDLFGHEKGSFTGAHARKIGKVEAADHGTLFLDEIGDMPLPLQAKILRFIQQRTFERVGSTQSVSVNVRVICATHRDFQKMIGDGTFREDLYYRVSEINLQLPALKKRGKDVLLIAQHLLSINRGDRALRFSKDAVGALEAWHWPGNIRELENRVKRAVVLCETSTISATDLELDPGGSQPVRKLKAVRSEAESVAIQSALVSTQFNISEASRLLGVSRPTLYSLIEKYGIAMEAGAGVVNE
jgi:two-component system NtrC family response regulator